MFYAIVAEADNAVIAVSRAKISHCARYHMIIEFVHVCPNGIAFDAANNEYDARNFFVIDRSSTKVPALRD